jgi:hypothetical protein
MVLEGLLPVGKVHVPRWLEGFPSSWQGTCTLPAGRKPFQPARMCLTGHLKGGYLRIPTRNEDAAFPGKSKRISGCTGPSYSVVEFPSTFVDIWVTSLSDSSGSSGYDIISKISALRQTIRVLKVEIGPTYGSYIHNYMAFFPYPNPYLCNKPGSGCIPPPTPAEKQLMCCMFVCFNFENPKSDLLFSSLQNLWLDSAWSSFYQDSPEYKEAALSDFCFPSSSPCGILLTHFFTHQ